MTPSAIRQRAFRDRRTAKMQRMEAVIREFSTSLAASKTPLGLRLKALADEALS